MTVRFGSCELDAARRQLVREGREIHLTPKAFELLTLLVDAAPRVVKKAELHDRLWPNGIVSDAMLVGLIKEIRRALDDRDKSAPLIRTVHRVGYAFAAPVARAPRPSSVSRWLIAGERRIVLVDGDNVIGRDPEANVQLDYATVSRRHARVVVAESSTMLEDLGSKNGTTIGGAKLTVAVELRNGDRFACGQVLLVYRESRAGFPTATHVSVTDEATGRR
ncbi:MAG TPA: FHA domain-containing protein [Gammaproteobacteria bacterium]|nr:FHA domain-containing protein [Gammaproteobacteria bacterium]